jgi:peptide chain release factor 1
MNSEITPEMGGRLAELERRYQELGEELAKPETFSDPARLRRVSQARARLEHVVGQFRELRSVRAQIADARSILATGEDPELENLARVELERLEARQEQLGDDLVVGLLPRDPNEDKDVIVEIRAGTGGEEAALFASDLYRMYVRYAEARGWTAEVLSSSPSEMGGIKEIIFSVSGAGAYRALKHESGVHRVQRVPATEAQGRIHTSTATVAVLPEAEEVEVQISPADLRIDTFRASSAGGQHVQKADSAVRITHLPTGIVASCQDERSQHQNREKAMRVLRAHLLEKMRAEQQSEITAVRRSQVGAGERSEKIRTYNFPQDRVTDHRIGRTWHNIEGILDGRLDPIVGALADAERAQLMEQIGKGADAPASA